MSSMFMSTISSINFIKEKINETTQKIITENKKDTEIVFTENTVSDSNLSTGIKTKQVYDDYNDFIVDEIRKTNAKVTEEKTTVEQLIQLSDLLCNKSNLFSTLIKEFYDQIEKDTIFGDQYTINERMQKQLRNILYSLKDFDRKLEFLEKHTQRIVEKQINMVNSLLENVIKINYLLNNTYANKKDEQHIKLVNMREKIVDQLNNLIGVRNIKSNGSYKIYLYNGTCILDDTAKTYLKPIKSDTNSQYISIGSTENEFSNNITNVENLFQTGSLGALLKFRREELNNARNTVGQLALNFSDSMNSFHTLGYDQYGQVGEQIFNIVQPEVMYDPINKSHVSIYAKWESANEAHASDYEVCLKDNQWIVTRLRDNTVIKPKVIRKKNNISFLYFYVDGISFNIQGTANNGDRYIVKPYSQILQELELMINQDTQFAISLTQDPDKINKNNSIAMHQFYKDKLVNNRETINEAYQSFSKDVIYKYRILEDGLPFKEKIISILNDKQNSQLENIDQQYQDLTYEQKCYAANAKILKVAEQILNDIISVYSSDIKN